MDKMLVGFIIFQAVAPVVHIADKAPMLLVVLEEADALVQVVGALMEILVLPIPVGVGVALIQMPHLVLRLQVETEGQAL